jgi:hypothetical protein
MALAPDLVLSLGERCLAYSLDVDSSEISSFSNDEKLAGTRWIQWILFIWFDVFELRDRTRIAMRRV